MYGYTQSLIHHLAVGFPILGAAVLLAPGAGCGPPDSPPISYPCKHPDPGHLDPAGRPDACHFEDPGSPAQAVTTFFNTVTAPFCEALYTCCTDATFLQDFAAGTLDGCNALWGNGAGLGSETLLALKGSLVDGTTVFDETKLDACVARLNARLMPTPAGAAACVEPVPFLLLNTCFSAAFQGQIPPGGACVTWPPAPEDLSFAECQGGRCVNGKCVPFLKPGDVCGHDAFSTDAPDTICDFTQGEWCKGPALTWTCGARTEIGGACEFDNRDYECKSLNCANQVCVPLSPNNTACDVF